MVERGAHCVSACSSLVGASLITGLDIGFDRVASGACAKVAGRFVRSVGVNGLAESVMALGWRSGSCVF